ncbi:22643_t:CDS:2 [Cetraspora pellucida]|uniref:Fucosyltransferase n=1 Tax=Cetraspora pellucida TaxID=1433469 RepID=A0A9N9E167_9GLOM|nr:22643_t:CDS:2 [Cetraspora pellucida]
MENDDTLILNWTPFFGEQTWEQYRIDYCGSDLPPCLITHNRTYLTQSHLLVFHAPDMNWVELPDKETRNVYDNKIPWVYYSAEAPAREWEFDDNMMRMFEFSLSYRLDSDFPATYLDEDLTTILRSPIYPFKDRKQVPVAWVVSNCHPVNGRHYYVKELLKYIDIDIYGKCMNNQEVLDPTINISDLIKQYKFYLAFENSNCDYYVTEKLLNAFIAGVVPIVDGPSDYTPFAPTNHSLIQIDQFSSPSELASYILSVSENEQAYSSYLSYKNNDSTLSEEFVKYWQGYNHQTGIFGYDFRGGRCKLCKLANQLRNFNNHDNQSSNNLFKDIFGDEISPKKFLYADRSCIFGKHNKYWNPLSIFSMPDSQYVYSVYFITLIIIFGLCVWVFKRIIFRRRIDKEPT